jgi:hypothetical protein
MLQQAAAAFIASNQNLLLPQHAGQAQQTALPQKCPQNHFEDTVKKKV